MLYSNLDTNRTINYFTGKLNYLNNINVLHTYDLKTEKAINDNDSVIEISFKELWDDLKIIFPYLTYSIDSSLNLRIEHESFLDAIST